MTMEGRMKLYLISQTANRDYDTYSDAVVAAKTKDEARLTHPESNHKWLNDDAGWVVTRNDGTTFSGCDTWASPTHVKVEYLGDAKPRTKAGVICSSFHAG
jgi:hypothetical protein